MTDPVAPKLHATPAVTEVTHTDDAAQSELAVKGRFARYNSPFLQLMIPLLTTRYLWLAIEDINPGNFLSKPDPSKTPGFQPWEKLSTSGYIKRNFAALGMGVTILGLVSFYSKRTADDIKTVYAEAVGYELGKKTEDVTWNDVFVKSQNEALQVTRTAFMKRTATRLLAGSAFLAPWHMLRDWKNHKPKYDANANAGVGAMGLYLSLFEGFMRKQSFFDAEQSLVGTTLDNTDRTGQDIILPKHIETLLFLDCRHKNPDCKAPAPASEAGKAQSRVAERVADLMNQTYKNIDRHEPANFTLGKLNYLVGFGHLKSYPESMAFIELSNKSKDMKDVKEAANLIKSGKDSHAVFKQFGIDTHSFATKAPPEQVGTKFTDKAPKSKRSDLLSLGPKGHQDFAEQLNMTNHLLS